MLASPEIIKSIYDKYNTILFNGKLPKINFEIRKLPSSWGIAHYKYIRNCKGKLTIKALDITITSVIDFTEWTLECVVVHEMIHIEDYTLNKEHFIRNGVKQRYDAHGAWFNKRVNEIQSCTNLLVGKYVEDELIKKSTDLRTPNGKAFEPSLLICFKDFNDTTFLMKIKPSYKEYWINEFKEYKKGDVYKYSEFATYETYSPRWQSERNRNTYALGYELTQGGMEDCIIKYEMRKLDSGMLRQA